MFKRIAVVGLAFLAALSVFVVPITGSVVGLGEAAAIGDTPATPAPPPKDPPPPPKPPPGQPQPTIEDWMVTLPDDRFVWAPSIGGGVGDPPLEKKPVPRPAGTWTNVWTTGPGQGVCPQKPDGRKPVSITRFQMYFLGNGDGTDLRGDGSKKVPGDYYMGFPTSGKICNYFDASVVETFTLNCPVRITGNITGPTRNPQGNPTNLITSINVASEWAKTGRGPNNCQAALGAGLGQTVTGDGYYRLDIATTTQSCTFKSYSGTQAPEKVGCQSEVTQDRDKWITVSCTIRQPQYPYNGWAEGKVGVSGWGADACKDEGPQFWSCVTPGVTFAGLPVRPTATVLDDGVHRQAVWGPLATDNVRNVRNPRTQFRVDPNSTPFRDGPLHQQPMEVALGQGWDSRGMNFVEPGDRRDVWVGWQQSSAPGKPSVLNRTVTFDGQFPMTQVEFDWVNLLTGQVQMVSTIAYVESTGSCDSAPLSVQVNHGRTVNAN